MKDKAIDRCPFCGGEAKEMITEDFRVYVQCTQCYARTKPFWQAGAFPPEFEKIDELRDKAIDNWNIRNDKKPLTSEEIKIKDLLLKISTAWAAIRESGGTDASCDYDKGWDQAIECVDGIMTETFGNDITAEPYEEESEEE